MTCVGAGAVRQIAQHWVFAIAGFAAFLKAAGSSRNTVRLRCHYLERVAAELGGSPWNADLEQLIGWLGRDGWSPETRKSARASLSTFYTWGVRCGRISADDNPAAQLPTVSVPRAVPRPTPDDVFEEALDGATDRDRLMLMLAGYAGLRRGEISRVHFSDVDHEGMQLLVRGKGGRQRWVPIHERLYAELVAELERRRSGGHGTGWRYVSYIDPAGGYLFPGRCGHIGPDVPGKVLAQLLGEHWTAHTLRHRFGTRAYAAERDLRAVQELLGHAKPETTAIYTAVPPDAMRRAVDAVGVAGDAA